MSYSQPELPKPLADIPKENVGQVVQSFIDNDGVRKLKVEQQPNGSFIITPQILENLDCL